MFVKKDRIAKLYINKLSKIHNFLEIPEFDKKSSWHLFRVKIKKDKIKLVKFLQENLIYSQLHYKPINLFSFYKKKDKFVNAEKYYRETLSLPIYFSLSKKDIERICNLIIRFFTK